MGRLIRLVDTGTSAGSLDKQWTYDANGNIRSVDTDYNQMNANGSFATVLTPSVEWYRYDALNRVIIAKGELSGGLIGRGVDGVEMTYDAAGQRMTSQTGLSPRT